MKTIILLLITTLSISSFGQKGVDIDVDTETLLNVYYPGDKTLYSNVIAFYDSIAQMRDTSTVDWLFAEQEKLSERLGDNFSINEKEGIKALHEALEEAHIQLSHSLPGFEFHISLYSDAELEEFEYLEEEPELIDVHANMQFLFDHASKQLLRGEPDETRLKIEGGFDIIFEAWSSIKHDYTTYCYDICCDCAQESALGSGLHSRLLTAIVIYTAHSNLFSEALKEIKQGIKNDVLYTYAFSSPKNAILAEFDIVKPLLGLSEEEALIYEKKRIYLEETSESGLHNYGR
jgi:hypothetical protein